MSSSSVSTLQSLLKRIPAFAALGEDRLSWLAERSSPFHCSVGQSLLLADRMPEYCYVIIEGRGRVLHRDPALRRPLTLAYANPGDLIGWAGLARRSPCEWITAATPLKLIGFSAETFAELDVNQIFRRFLTRILSSRNHGVLEPALRKRPHAEPHERDVLRQLLPQRSCCC